MVALGCVPFGPSLQVQTSSKDVGRGSRLQGVPSREWRWGKQGAHKYIGVGRKRARVFAQLQTRPTTVKGDDLPQRDASYQPSVSSPPPRTTLPEMWPELAARYGDAIALDDPHAPTPTQYTYTQLSNTISTLSAGFQTLGLKAGDRVSLFSENSSRWMVADQAIMAAGAADAVRGVSSTLEELRFIMENSQSRGLVVQDAAALDKLLPVLLTALQHAGNGHEAPSTESHTLSSLSESGIEWVMVLWGSPSEEARGSLSSSSMPVLTFDQVLDLGKTAAPSCLLQDSPKDSQGTSQESNQDHNATASHFSSNKNNSNSQEVATLVYTSGTTSHPKGVQLTHANLLYQVSNLSTYLKVYPGERTLSLLPPWHIYERTCAYYILSSGATQTYTNIKKFRDDLQRYAPDHFVCVPLVLDTLHTKVMSTLKKASALRRTLALSLLSAAVAATRAKRVLLGIALQHALQPPSWFQLFKAWVTATALSPLVWLFRRLVSSKIRTAVGIKKHVVSGGGSLAPHLDDFYETIGLTVLNGWGMTEASPVLACRAAAPLDNVRGTVGQAIPGTQLRIVDPEHKSQDVEDGQQGLILAKGPGIMAGYESNAGATAAAFIGDGWFDTGDLGWRAPSGIAHSNMAGCIVLTGRSKDTLVLTSGENVEPQPIEDDMCTSPYIKFAMLLGQGHRALGALVVPDVEHISEGMEEGEVERLVKKEVARVTRHRMRWEQVHEVQVLKEPFSIDNGTLTRTMKLRRAAIVAKYSNDIAALERRLR